MTTENNYDLIIIKWKKLEDTELERELFVQYNNVRDELIKILQRNVLGKCTSDELLAAVGAEKMAFERYVDHRLNSKFRK